MPAVRQDRVLSRPTPGAPRVALRPLRLAPALTLVLVLGTTGPAHAQRGRYTRTGAPAIEVKVSDRARPARAPAAAAAAPAPTLDGDQVLRIEAKVVDLRGTQAAYLREIIADTPDSETDEKADLYLRLADLYAGTERHWRLTATQADLAADAATAAAVRDQHRRAATAAREQARRALVAAIEQYRLLTDNPVFRNTARMDQALFYYGYALRGSGHHKEARAVYERLLKHYPASRYVPEAHLSFADYHFEAGQLVDAEIRYQRVLQFPRASVAPYARYKLGWVYLNQGRELDALATFHEVVEHSRGVPAQAALHRAARADLVRAYAAVGDVGLALPYFRKVGGGEALMMLERLGDLYREQGKAPKAISVFRELITLRPRDHAVCTWQHHVAQATLTTGTAPQRVAEIVRLVELYEARRGDAAWPAAAARECRDDAAAMSGELAAAWHAEWSRTRDPALHAAALGLYPVYLRAFRDDPGHARAQYYFAELLWAGAEAEPDPRRQVERWAETGEAFAAVVDAGRAPRALLEESAWAGALAQIAANDVDPRRAPVEPDQAGPDAGPPPSPRPIPARAQAMLDAFARFQRTVRTGREVERVGLRFLEANLYRRYHHHDEALPRFIEIVTKHPAHETAPFAANLLLDGLARLGRDDELARWVKRLHGDRVLLAAAPELGPRLDRLSIQVARKRAERLEATARRTGDLTAFVACGKAYTTIFNRDPEAEGSDQVLYNAAVCFEQGKSVGLAISMYRRLEDLEAAEPQVRARGMARLGVAYAQVAFYQQAARTLEQYFDKYGATAGAHELKAAEDALGDAVFFHKGLGQDDQAIKATMKYIGHPRVTPTQRARAFFGLHAIYEKNGDDDGLVRHLRRYLREFARAGDPGAVVVAHTKLGLALWRKSCPVASVDGSCVRVWRERAVARAGQHLGRALRTQAGQCGETSRVRLTVVPRTPGAQRAAMDAFTAAVAAGAALGDRVDPAARHHAAQARFHLAERAFEAYLAVVFPANLDFDPGHPAVAAASHARFARFMADKERLGAAARQAYEAVAATRDAATMIAAVARRGQIAQHAADVLYTAEVPRNLRPHAEAVEVYCDTLMERADPLAQATITAFGVFLEQARALGWSSDWSRLCERELGQLRPAEFPTATELRDRPGQVGAAVAVVGPEPVAPAP